VKVGRRGFIGALLALPFLSRLLPAPKPGPITLRNLTDDGTFYTHIFQDGGNVFFYDANTGKQTPVVADPGCVGACKSEVGAA
jgi:hypothetical protein